MALPAKRKHRVKVTIDESLDRYDNVIPFSEKHEKMNEILKRTDHPENYLKKK